MTQVTEADYRACALRGMTVTQTAEALGVSPPAVVKAARRLRISFSDRQARSDDERLLHMLRWRCEGHSSQAIGNALGMTPERVRVATQRVRDADYAESGEPEHTLARHYDWARTYR